MYSWMRVSLVLAFLFVSAPALYADSFTPQEKQNLQQELRNDQSVEQSLANYDRVWDLVLKILVLVIAVLTTVGTGYAGTFATDALPRWLRIANFALASITASLGTLVSQLDLQGGQSVHQRKATALQYLADTVQYTDPDKQSFLTQVQRVREATDPKQLVLVSPEQKSGSSESPKK
jgi:hypothetical protein